MNKNGKEQNISLNPKKLLLSTEHSVSKGFPTNTMSKNPVFVSQLKLKQTGKTW